MINYIIYNFTTLAEYYIMSIDYNRIVQSLQ